MDFKRIAQIYDEQYIDQEWWGDFPTASNLVERGIYSRNIVELVSVCAKIGLHITGEIPRLVLSNKAPNLLMDAQNITLNLKMLRLDLPDEIRINALFGSFIHELGHAVYTVKDHAEAGAPRYSPVMYQLIHLIEDRRMESKLVRDFPGYHFYLYINRRLGLSIGMEGIEQHVGFYGGNNEYEGIEAIWDYICSAILYPNILEDSIYLREVTCFLENIQKVQQVNILLRNIRNYANLSWKDVYELAERLQQIIANVECVSENFVLQEMKNALKGLEDFETDREIRLAESVVKDLRKTLNPETLYFNEFTTRSKHNRMQQSNQTTFSTIREIEAKSGEITEEQLNKARELASQIRLTLSMFTAKMDKIRMIYEQDSGELDEDELYQSSFNRHIFVEELLAPSAMLEVVILLDLSGSMITNDKISLQIVISTALALAFEKYVNVVAYSIYGHRCDDDGVEITCFHEAGSKLQLGKLFSQQAVYANADGYAMLYCFNKFKSDARNKLFFMISDGTPSVSGYEGENARDHVQEVVYQGKKRNIEVLSIGIDNFDQADMYNEFIPYSGPEITTKLSQWIKRKFSLIADGASF